MRKPFIAGNWKMYKITPEAQAYAKEFKNLVQNVTDRDILICAPFTLLGTLAKEWNNSNILLGAQNMYFEKEGAFTGEISPLQLKDIGAQYVILGHSERRHILKETDALINKKVHAALQNDLLPILCVGELLEEREANKTETVVKTHVVEGFKGLSQSDALKVTIAYEPVWAIGTGKTATPEDADAVHVFIRKVLAEIYDSSTAEAIRIQYGGSVKTDNVDSLMAKPNIDGALVGGASLKADSFARIVGFVKI
jgi:triosephosphate isomerase